MRKIRLSKDPRTPIVSVEPARRPKQKEVVYSPAIVRDRRGGLVNLEDQSTWQPTNEEEHWELVGKMCHRRYQQMRQEPEKYAVSMEEYERLLKEAGLEE